MEIVLNHFAFNSLKNRMNRKKNPTGIGFFTHISVFLQSFPFLHQTFKRGLQAFEFTV